MVPSGNTVLDRVPGIVFTSFTTSRRNSAGTGRLILLLYTKKTVAATHISTPQPQTTSFSYPPRAFADRALATASLHLRPFQEKLPQTATSNDPVIFLFFRFCDDGLRQVVFQNSGNTDQPCTPAQDPAARVVPAVSAHRDQLPPDNFRATNCQICVCDIRVKCVWPIIGTG